MRALLGLVHNHNKLAGRTSHNFFPKQRTTTTFDKIKLRIDLVCPIHSYINIPGSIVAQ